MIATAGYSQQTVVTGKINDALTGEPLPLCSIIFSGSDHGTVSDSLGRFQLSADKGYNRITVTAVGYQLFSQTVVPGTVNRLVIKLEKKRRQLSEVAISARKKGYRNKNNPAVELIRKVIANKEINRPQSSPYLQYNRYERVGMTMSDIPPLLINNFIFKPYRFMIDTIKGKLSAQVYLSEKRYHYYERQKPAKSIQLLQADKESNIIKFLDTTGINIYINRLFGNHVDIYENNIFIINFQFLSPIANLAPDFYRFFITDTLRAGKDTLVRLDFAPRNKADLLFEGHLLVNISKHYAVTACELRVDKQINVNFLRSLNINLDFEPQASGQYFLVKSDAVTDFGILKNKGVGLTGKRTVWYSDYQTGPPADPLIFDGKSQQVAADLHPADTAYWLHLRPDTLPAKDDQFYRRVSHLEQMKSFKRATWIASVLANGFADLGPFQFNMSDFISYSTYQGARFGAGGRTTPQFNRTFYLEGYAAAAPRDGKLNYNATAFYSFNQTAPYRYPNNYLKISQQYDIGLPGEQQGIGNFRTPLSGFQTGGTAYYFYANAFKLDYVKEFDNHFSFDAGFYRRDEHAAGTLTYTLNDTKNTPVTHITSSVFDISLRYAPREQIFQGATGRATIQSQYPIITLLASQGINGIWGSTYNYTSLTLNVAKRVYMSQLGWGDMTLLSGVILGKVPFPLLNISNANQSIVYDPNGYNQMHYLEFVSDHYAGINYTQSFNGFFLNKLPLISGLKWREFLSFKILYGGLRNQNNPLKSNGLYNFPAPVSGASGTYALGQTPYVEGGLGIGNIFKLLRVDAIRRFNYLDHPGVSAYGLKLTLNLDL